MTQTVARAAAPVRARRARRICRSRWGSSAELLQLEDALTSGKHLQSLEIEAYHAVGAGKQQLVDQYVFQDLLVTSLQTSNSVSNSVSVDFGEFSRGHVEYDAKGIGHITEAGWDFVQNTDFSAPVDADLGKSVLPSVDSSASLEYFIRFEGQDWMRLEGFSLGLSQTGTATPVAVPGGQGDGDRHPHDARHERAAGRAQRRSHLGHAHPERGDRGLRRRPGAAAAGGPVLLRGRAADRPADQRGRR